MNKDKLELLKNWEFKYSAYGLALNTCYFDDETIAPKNGQDYRYARLAFMAGERHKIATDPEVGNLLKELKDDDLDEVNKRKVSLLIKNFEDMSKIPQKEFEEYTALTLKSSAVWQEAKKRADYSLFAPYLADLIAYQKRFAAYRNPQIAPYDVLLDDYEEGMTMADYDQFFELLKKEIVPLLHDVQKAKAIDDSFLYLYYPRQKQLLLMEKIKDVLGFDASWGYMGESMHPFTCGFSQDDVRVTNAYDEHNIAAAIYSLVHEVGHAYYEHQIDKDYAGTVLKNVSSGMHESQSRLLENYIGRRKKFIASFYPELVKLFPENLGDVSLEAFWAAINVAKPSLIRTDADELTYPLHILIRYEIEKRLFNGELDTKNLNKVWNAYYKEYLGIEVPDDVRGILQDIHWSQGDFGYFPTYALGSAVAAQIVHKMADDIDIDDSIDSHISKITDYLGMHIQHYGALYPLQELLEKTSGEKFNPQYYIDYLKTKYRKLYNLD